MSSRSRRFSRLRTTAEPTARLTTKPTFGPVSLGTGPTGKSSAPETTEPPARRPERSVRRNSSGFLIRVCWGSTTPPARPWPADGCSAGTYACSLELQTRCDVRGGHAVRRAVRSWPDLGQAAPTDATRVSLLTVKAIGAQVKPTRAQRQVLLVRPATIMEHRDFHSASAAGDLGCGKSTSAVRPGGSQLPPGSGGNRGTAHVHTLWTDLWTTSCGRRPRDRNSGVAVRRGEPSVGDLDLGQVWARSLKALAEMHVGPSPFAWLKPELTRPLGLVEDTVLIATPNAFVKEQLETRLRPLVIHALSRELGRPIQLAVTVDPRPASPQEPPPGPPSSPLSVMDAPGVQQQQPPVQEQPEQYPYESTGWPSQGGQESTGWPSQGGQEIPPEQLSFNRPAQPSPSHQHEPAGLSGMSSPDQQSRQQPQQGQHGQHGQQG